VSLTIRLLGSPEITVGGQPLSFRTRKALALLVYLVVEEGMQSRETLINLLWPEIPVQKAAISLRVTLTRLRQALQPAGEVLLSETGVIGFDFSCSVDLDLAWLAAAVLPQASPDDLGAILNLDRGEFLAGFSLADAPDFDTWAAIQREAIQRQVESVYDRLTQHQLAKRESDSVVETATRWVARAPLSEAAYRRLMAAQALAGDRPAALKTYAQCQAMLQKEFGIKPARETAVLADHIGHDRLPGGPGRWTTVPGSPLAMPATQSRHGLLLPFEGRAVEHGHLVAAFRQAGQTGVQVVTVIGAAGVGKTRLLDAFRDWVVLDSPGAEIWQGRAFELGGHLPYQPVIEALRLRLEQENAPEDLLDDVWLAELSQLMPELRTRYPDLPPPMSGDAGLVRARLFSAVATLGSALAARNPAVFILDDMQWADTDTRDMLHYLARRWVESGTPILLLLSIRQEGFAADTPLREWLGQLGRDVPLRRLLLDPLNGTAVEQLVARLADPNAGREATEAFGAWLWAETRGLPFFIEALLQMLVEEGILAVKEVEGRRGYEFAAALAQVRSGGQVPVPPGVSEAILSRLGRLSQREADLLLAASVLGRECSFETLSQAADIAELDALAAVEALLNGRLLSEKSGTRRPYTLAHDYIREVVYGASHEARRRIFHRRALIALEAERASAAECAYHAVAALLDEPAFRFSVVAGGEAFASYALQDALSHLDAARQAAQRMQARDEVVDEDLLERLYDQRGQALEVNQDDEAAQANYEEMRAEAVKLQSKTLELSGLIAQSNLHGHYTGVFNPLKSKELAQAALVLARELGDKAAEARALWALQVAEVYSAGEIQQAVAYGEQALALARQLGLKDLIGLVLNNLCWPIGAQKPLQQSRDELKEAQAIWQELGNLPRLAEASRFMLIFHNLAGDHRRTLVDAPKLAELGASIGSRLDEVESFLWLASAYIRQGRFSQALDCLDRYGAYADSLGHPNEKHGHQWGRIKLYLAVGALDNAERWADELFTQRETIPPNFITVYFFEIARVKVARGELEEGRAILDELLKNLPIDAGWSYMIIEIAVGYGELNLALGQPEALFAGLEERVRPYREAGFNARLADEHWLRGRAALALGQYDAAREALLKAKEAAEAQEERAILWKILSTLSELEGACGDKDAAEKLREQAMALVDDIAAHAGELREAFLAQTAVAQVLSEN
jgi:DNA-binding SARP family transcriptional activator/tetratricopeptide (TPR) repeat protein